ncbi:hypothetical protein [Cellulomonas carbonis]|uniref:Uncharacterized protein n=1 Tax=Cellulomonas carbonis T26 TaxID=947969 RepID=A0A0A0BRY1_9CELL|nr:hypothetical protein [Cellulomonas carbonis]KGM09894.1 hypothetical protein N868_17830 [Cellulomonas carbonis T26]
MGPVLLTLALALAVSVGVVALSALVSAGGPDGVRRQLAEVRAALRERRDVGPATTPRDDDDEDELSVDAIFAVGRPDPQGYVDADELADALQRAGSAVVGRVSGVAHRARR